MDRNKAVGLGLNIVYCIVAVALSAVFAGGSFDYTMWGAIGWLGVPILYVTCVIAGEYPSIWRIVITFAGAGLIVAGAAVSLSQYIVGTACDLHVIYSGSWWISAGFITFSFLFLRSCYFYGKAVKFFVPASYAVGFALSAVLSCLPAAESFILVAGIAVPSLGALILNANKERAVSYGSEGVPRGVRTSLKSFAPVEKVSESGLADAVRAALPSKGESLGEWEHGEAFLSDIAIKADFSLRAIELSGEVEYKLKRLDCLVPSMIGEAAQKHLDGVAKILVSRAVSAVNEYLKSCRSGEGDWSVSLTGLSAAVSIE